MSSQSLDLNQLPPLRDIISQYDLRADKKLGQHFLLDLNLTRRIVRAAGDLSGLHIIEIGPGPGGLTRALLESNAASLYAIEYDARCIMALQNLVALAPQRLTLHQADALKLDAASLTPAPRAVIANLPYNIGTALLVKFLSDAAAYAHFTLMLQAEVVARCIAPPGSKTYGRLSVLCQWRCDAENLFSVPASAFTPPPQVESAILHLRPKTQCDIGLQPYLERVTAAAFGQRRKMLRQSLKSIGGERLLTKANLAADLRAENLSVENFITLAGIIRQETPISKQSEKA